MHKNKKKLSQNAKYLGGTLKKSTNQWHASDNVNEYK